MTALDRYAKLEAVARYHDGRAAPPREVVLSFGERSLVIMGMNDEPIAHWPLASLRAPGPPGQMPVELVPDPTSDERLLLDDAEMSAAIREVCPKLHSAPPPPHRRLPRRALAALVAVVVLAAAGAALWPYLPESLLDVVPPEREAALGETVAARLPAMLAGSAPPGLCVAEEGLAALRELTERVFPVPAPGALTAGTATASVPRPGGQPGSRPLRVSVLDDPATDALALPGGHVVILRGLLQAAETPEEIAAVLAHAIAHAQARDPLRAVLDQAGAGALAAMVIGDITGELVLADAAEALRAAYPPEAEAAADAAAFAMLAEADLPSEAYAALADRLAGDGASHYTARHLWSDARARAALDADTIGAQPFRPALRDRDWIALANICDRTRPADPAGY